MNEDQGDYAGAQLPLPNGRGVATYQGRRAKTFHTVLGDITLSRAYYYDADSGTGF